MRRSDVVFDVRRRRRLPRQEFLSQGAGTLKDMERQLVLVEANRSWKLDEETREAGRRGVAKARELLRQTTQDNRAA